MSRDHDEQYEREDVLQWCLDPSSRSSDAERALEGNPELRETLEDYESSVASLRAAFASEEATSVAGGAGSEALVGEILGATTREDLTWRGDLRLVRDYMGRRMSSSWAVKLVAASLVIHLSALPILGYMLLTEQARPHFNLRIEEPVEPPYEEVLPEPDRELDDPDFSDPDEFRRDERR